MGTPVYKICSKIAWREALARGRYEGSPDDRRDGFIHLSAPDQVAGTLAKHFAHQRDLVLVAFAPALLGAQLKWETSRGGALFPHFHGPLPVEAHLWCRDIAMDGNVHVVPDPAGLT